MADILRANAEQMAQFVAALFPYADEDSFVSLRAFDQKERGKPAFAVDGVRLGDHKRLLDQAVRIAEQSANSLTSTVFAPPVATFNNPKQARHVDLANGVALSVEVDAGNTAAARATLQHILGPVTICMESGSYWMDPDTGEFHPKLHLHWRLSEPTRSAVDHDRLREARWCAAILVGGDTTAAPPCHPLRWPGSWNTKNKPRLARITVGNQAAEIHLHDALDKLQAAVEAAGLDTTPAAERVSGEPQAPLEIVCSALRRIPNADVHWDEWNRVGMAAWAATGGSTVGLQAWADWSAQSGKHEEQACADRWSHYGSSPPSRIGAGTIIHMAKLAGWERPRAEQRTKPPEPDPARPVEPGEEPPLKVVYYDAIQPNLDAADFVEGLLITSAMSVVYGQSNSGKTFWCSDLALHIASGMAWCGREVQHGGVLWLAMEGAFGISNRVAAWAEHYSIGTASVHFATIPVALNLLDPEADVQPLIRTIKIVAARMRVPVVLVVVDTLSRAIAGGNENSPEDMGALVTNGSAIQQLTNAHVMWIHHSGKDEAKGARGHTSLRAATDTEIEITSDGSSRQARVTKQRELPCDGEFAFSLKVIDLGENKRGKPVTSCVVVHSCEGDACSAMGPGSHTSVARHMTRLRGHAKRALEVLTDLVAQSGQSGHAGLPAGSMSVPEKWWRERFMERAMPGSEYDAKQKGFKRAATDLINQHIVGLERGRVWIVSYQSGGKANDSDAN